MCLTAAVYWVYEMFLSEVYIHAEIDNGFGPVSTFRALRLFSISRIYPDWKLGVNQSRNPLTWKRVLEVQMCRHLPFVDVILSRVQFHSFKGTTLVEELAIGPLRIEVPFKHTPSIIVGRDKSLGPARLRISRFKSSLKCGYSMHQNWYDFSLYTKSVGMTLSKRKRSK